MINFWSQSSYKQKGEKVRALDGETAIPSKVKVGRGKKSGGGQTSHRQ